MFNYNVINPVNINYRKYPQKDEVKNSAGENLKTPVKSATEEQNNGQRKFPNGNDVAIDYTKNQINIAQVLQDFRSTIAAINSPDYVKEEVEQYLQLVSKETKKQEPSREIVLANLKNAARVTDKYIQESLKKPSKVVQDWVDALFLQRINLKEDPKEINEEFRVKIPPKKETTQTQVPSGVAPLKEDTVSFSGAKSVEDNEQVYTITATPTKTTQEEIALAEEFAEAYDGDYIEEDITPQQIEPTQAEPQVKLSPYAPTTEKEALAKETLLKGKATFENGGDIYSTLKLYDEALELIQGSENQNLKSAIYFERAKVFDSYDFAELALIDYNKATKSEDGNLRAQAHIKMGNIYDDYVQFDPAIDQYSRAIVSSEEANNPYGKTKALRHIASMFTRIYDEDNTQSFSDLSIESAKETQNSKTIATTYLEVANNYKYIGDDTKALKTYGALAQEESVREDYEALAQNYMEASMLMDKKGNKKKAFALLQKSKEYQRKARLNRLAS